MIRSESQAAAQQISAPSSILRDMHFVHSDGPSVRVRRYVVEDERGVRFAAELIAHEAGIERAVIDAPSPDALGALIEPAARAFALSIRLRSKLGRVARP
jgi:hypothetical protein